MNSFPVPFKIIATVLLTAVLLAVGILNVRDRAEWVDPTDGVYWVDGEAGLVATSVARAAREAAGIQVGDRLLSINGRGRPISDSTSTFSTASGPNASVTYEIAGSLGAKNGSLAAGREELPARPAGRAAHHSRIPAPRYRSFSSGLRGFGLPRAFHFYLISVAAFVVYLYSYTPRLEAFDWTVYGLSLAAFLLLPALFVHFCMRFPIDSARGRSRAPLDLHAGAGARPLQSLWMTGRLANFGLPRTANASMVLDRIELVYFCAGFIVGWRAAADSSGTVP